MKYKRESPFRYTFPKPLEALFIITAIDGKPVRTSQGKAELVDISTVGVRLRSELHIQNANHKSTQLVISFKLNDQQLEFSGEIVWEKQSVNTTDYGVDIETDEADKQILIEQLKIYTKDNKQE